MGRRFPRVIRGGRQVRESRWLDAIPVVQTLAAASTAAITHSLSAVELALRPFTIVRTRGLFSVISDQSAQTEDQQVGVGFSVVSDQAVAIGVTAVPTPYTDMESDLFFLYEQHFSHFLFSSAVGLQDEGNRAVTRFDSKAMRKVEDGQDIVSTIETSSISSGAIVRLAFRMLVKLH